MKKDVSNLNYFNNSFVSSADLSKAVNFREIPVSPLKDFYPLTFSQRRIYNSNDNSNNTILGILFGTKLAPSKIQNILNKLIQIHSSLRCVFKYMDGKTVSSILDNQTITIETERSSFDVQTLVDNYYNSFDLTNGPLLHSKIVFLENGSSLLLLDIHNIALDKISIKVFLEDFFALYNEKEITEHSLEYRDYAVFEDNFLNSDLSKSCDNFWMGKFKNQDFTKLNLPYDFTSSKSYASEKVDLELSKDYLEKVENLAKSLNSSNYLILLSCLYILLYKYTSKPEITIGTFFDGRCFKDALKILGNFENKLALNEHIDEKSSFKDFVTLAHKDLKNGMENGIYPYEILEKKLGLSEKDSLFDIMFEFEKEENSFESDAVKIFVKEKTQENSSDLNFKVNSSITKLTLEFNKTLFKESTAKSILAHYLFILKQALKNKDLSVSNFEIITPEENKLLEKFEAENKFTYILDKNMKRVPIGTSGRIYEVKNKLDEKDLETFDNPFGKGKIYKTDNIGKWTFEGKIEILGNVSEYNKKFATKPKKKTSSSLQNKNYDFLKSYDYTKVDKVLERNTVQNFKTISKIEVRKHIANSVELGYLGAHIAYEFLTENTGILYALIRSKDNIPSRYRFLQTLRFYFGAKFVSKMEERIKVVPGDFTENGTLGTTKDDLRDIASNVNVVINSGALVKHFGNKSEFEKVNVTGPKNVIEFCMKYGKRLLHISTTSVSGTDRKDEIENQYIFSERNLYIGQDFTNIYITTKYEAEIAVLEAIHDGLDSQILRLGNITNRYSDGAFQKNVSDNAFANRLKSFIEIGAFPKYLLEHAIELTPVDLAARAVNKILIHSSDCNVFHIMNTLLLEVKELIDTIHSLGIDLIPVSNTLMYDIINGMLLNDDRKQAVSGIIQDLNKDKKLIYTSSTRLDFDFTEKYLKECGFKWKKIDKNYITKYLNYFKSIGFIDF